MAWLKSSFIYIYSCRLNPGINYTRNESVDIVERLTFAIELIAQKVASFEADSINVLEIYIYIYTTDGQFN